MTSCHTHCEAQNDGPWMNFAINGVSMRDAVAAWMTSNAASGGVTPSAENWHFDCTYNANAPVQCNPTC